MCDNSMAYLWHKCFVSYSDYGALTEVNACTWRMLNVRYIAVASGVGGGGGLSHIFMTGACGLEVDCTLKAYPFILFFIKTYHILLYFRLLK